MTCCAYFPPETPEIDVCLACGLVGWSCVCDPSRPACKRTEARLQRARRARLTVAELNSLGVAGENLDALESGEGAA